MRLWLRVTRKVSSLLLLLSFIFAGSIGFSFQPPGFCSCRGSKGDIRTWFIKSMYSKPFPYHYQFCQKCPAHTSPNTQRERHSRMSLGASSFKLNDSQIYQRFPMQRHRPKRLSDCGHLKFPFDLILFMGVWKMLDELILLLEKQYREDIVVGYWCKQILFGNICPGIHDISKRVQTVNVHYHISFFFRPVIVPICLWVR